MDDTDKQTLQNHMHCAISESPFEESELSLFFVDRDILIQLEEDGKIISKNGVYYPLVEAPVLSISIRDVGPKEKEIYQVINHVSRTLVENVEIERVECEFYYGKKGLIPQFLIYYLLIGTIWIHQGTTYKVTSINTTSKVILIQPIRKVNYVTTPKSHIALKTASGCKTKELGKYTFCLGFVDSIFIHKNLLFNLIEK